ncbi:hypothetical protein LUZ63_004281 [Rhynchospora breviuscula]|uniref:DRBM domain-containing protein n=1 Tax=Rhynchospora breviuscula TaxID=2022672 RepID=A0A9Q0HZU7_9POAL|nr:hypothetical protein LUZ63_004281 [Rhynchospora breviuscula]
MEALPSNNNNNNNKVSALSSNFKGKLFTFALTHGFGQPNYTFKNEGYPHAPLFRATVDVAGRTFTASETFKHLKDAHHFVSKLALDTLSHHTTATANVPDPSFLKGSKLCKTILHEFSAKKRPMDLPSYQTGVPEHGPANMFVSRVVFKNNTFVGPISRSKNDAEHNAAHVAISSLLENIESRCLMSKVIQKVMGAPAESAESNPRQNPNPNINASTVGSVTRPEEVTEKNLPIPPGFWTLPEYLIANNTCKSILKEYCDKKGCQDMPLYNTYTKPGPVQGYIASVSLEGNTYNGLPSKSKKEAEQAAARVAIIGILGNPASRIYMLQAMQSKTILDPSPGINLIANPSTNPQPNEGSSCLHLVSADPKTNQVGDGCTVLMGSPSVVICPGTASSVFGQSEGKEVDHSSYVNLISNCSTNPKLNEEKFHLDQVSTKSKPNQVGDNITLTGSLPLVNCCLGSGESVLGQSEGKQVEPPPELILISNPGTNPKPNEEESHLHQVSTKTKPNQIGDISHTVMESLPLVKGSAELLLGQNEGEKVENLPAMVPSKNARKRARKKEKKLQDKKVKLEC